VIHVRRSAILDAPVDAVWRVLRDFNSHGEWHPAVAASAIEGGGPGDAVGCVRRFRLRDGAELTEQLLTLSDRERTLRYCILDAPLPLGGYIAEIRLRPVTDGGRTFWDWRSQFTAPPDQADELAHLVGEDIYVAGFEGLRRFLRGERTAAPSASPTRAPAAGARPQSCGGIVVTRHGGPEVLEWRRVEAPAPGPGQVRIRQTAIGLNYIDVYCRTGYVRLMSLPGTPGMEAAGIVLDTGPGVTLSPGTRVAYACPPPGAYVEIRTLDADLVVPLPDTIDDQTAAAGLLKGLTAEFLLHVVHEVGEGDLVLVHAAAGGVGSLLCQWASALGATVIGTVGSPAKQAEASRHGCAHVVLLEDGWPARVLELTGGRGVAVAYDAVGRATFEGSFEALAARSHLVSYGQASGDIGPVEISRFADKSARVSRPNYGHYMGTSPDLQRGSRRLFEALRRGTLTIEINQRFPLRDAAAAHTALEARRTTGSTILLPES
jgi:NADPH:quinone reductase-like Zn-dependent oxidoreductase